MKVSTLCLLACVALFSCQEEYSNEGSNENIFKNRPPQKINIQNTGGIGTSDKAPQVQAVPFDFGLSAALGAGLLAATRLARKRRQETV